MATDGQILKQLAKQYNDQYKSKCVNCGRNPNILTNTIEKKPKRPPTIRPISNTDWADLMTIMPADH